MKKMIVLIFTCIISFACSKNDIDNTDNFPGVLYLYFDIKKSDNTPFEEGEILYSQENIFNGEHSGNPEEWVVLEKTFNGLLGEEPFFGPCGEYMYGWEDGDEPAQGSQWVNKTIVYLKYMNTGIIDTIMLRDSANYPDYRYYDLYLNGNEIEYSKAPNNIEWLISITKEEF